MGQMMRNSAAARSAARVRRPGDQLRQLLQLAQRLALHDPLGAVRQVHVAAARLLELPGQPVGHAGEDRAAQHQQLPGPDPLEQLVHRAVELADRRVEVLVDRRADGDDDGGGVFQHGRVGGRLDEAGPDGFGQQGVGIVLVKGHLARC